MVLVCVTFGRRIIPRSWLRASSFCLRVWFAGHWIPVVLTPNGKTLLFTTWDLPSHAHDDLNVVIEKIGKLLGFDQVTILRHQRLFFMSDKCGALAMAFLHHSVFNSMLPANNDDADLVHCRLREAYRQEVVRCQIARRPWILGSR